jgi:hypothetical protein
VFKFISTNIVLSKILYFVYFNLSALQLTLVIGYGGLRSLELNFVANQSVLEKSSSHSHALVNLLLHGVGLLLDASNELKDEVDNFFFLKFVEVLLADHKTEVELFINGLASQNLEFVSTLLEEDSELASDKVGHGILFVNTDRYSAGVDTTFNQALFSLTLGNSDGREKKFGVLLEFDLVVDLTLDLLRGELPEVETGFHALSDVSQVLS